MSRAVRVEFAMSGSGSKNRKSSEKVNVARLLPLADRSGHSGSSGRACEWVVGHEQDASRSGDFEHGAQRPWRSRLRDVETPETAFDAVRKIAELGLVGETIDQASIGL